MARGKVRLNFEVSPKQRKILKAIATEFDVPLTAIARELFEQYIKDCLDNPDLPDSIKRQIVVYLRD